MPAFANRWITRQTLKEWLVLDLVLLFIGACFAYLLNQDHDRVDAREKERLSHQCVVVSMNLSRQFSTINTALTGILVEVPNWRRKKDGQSLSDQH